MTLHHIPYAKASPSGLRPPELALWLEWAGAKLLALGIRSPRPGGYRTAWPAYAPEPQVAYGYSGERLKPSVPDKDEIDLMDEVLALPALVDDVNMRRIINARSLVAPISNRHLYSWSKIAHMLGLTADRTRRLYNHGMDDICRKLSQDKVAAMRHSLSPHLH